MRQQLWTVPESYPDILNRSSKFRHHWQASDDFHQDIDRIAYYEERFVIFNLWIAGAAICGYQAG